MSTVFRVEKTANYTVMSNTHLKDRRLSYKSKGLLSVILSLPPEWDYTITGLAVIATDGVDSVKTAIKELEKYGYVTRSQLRDERGRMAQNEYVVCSSSPTIRVNGEFVSQEVVKSRFLKLTEEEIDYVLYALKHNSSRIGNMRSYLITALYNSKSTMCNYYANMAYNDMRCGVM